MEHTICVLDINDHNDLSRTEFEPAPLSSTEELKQVRKPLGHGDTSLTDTTENIEADDRIILVPTRKS